MCLISTWAQSHITQTWWIFLFCFYISCWDTTIILPLHLLLGHNQLMSNSIFCYLLQFLLFPPHIIYLCKCAWEGIVVTYCSMCRGSIHLFSCFLNNQEYRDTRLPMPIKIMQKKRYPIYNNFNLYHYLSSFESLGGSAHIYHPLRSSASLLPISSMWSKGIDKLLSFSKLTGLTPALPQLVFFYWLGHWPCA